MYYRNRYYDTQTGRFLQPDPTGYLDGMNLHEYVTSNPILYLDPSGLMSKKEILKKIAEGIAKKLVELGIKKLKPGSSDDDIPSESFEPDCGPGTWLEKEYVVIRKLSHNLKTRSTEMRNGTVFRDRTSTKGKEVGAIKHIYYKCQKKCTGCRECIYRRTDSLKQCI